MSNKVVYNYSYGLAFLDDKILNYLRKKGKIVDPYHFCRHDPDIIEFIEKHNGEHNGLKLATIEGNKYAIKEYDGLETVFEPKDIDWISIKSDKYPYSMLKIKHKNDIRENYG